MKNIVRTRRGKAALSLAVACAACVASAGCAYAGSIEDVQTDSTQMIVQTQEEQGADALASNGFTAAGSKTTQSVSKPKITKMYYSRFNHGKKTAKQTKYIVLHDTEVANAGAATIATSWKNANNGYVAAHFVVGRDGAIVQCVPLNKIAHHAGFGNKGHNKKFGVSSKRDDMRGVTSIGGSYPDYGMNACSIGIEICHASGESYTKAQLKSLDKLIAYIDYKLGKKCKIIDHKMWRTTNSDTSAAFAKYLKNYKSKRHH